MKFSSTCFSSTPRSSNFRRSFGLFLSQSHGEAKSKYKRQDSALRALGLLLYSQIHSGKGEDFLTGQPDFFTETAVTPERKVEKSFPRWEINRHVEG